MERAGASSPAQEGFLHTGKAFNVYQAKLLRALAAIEQPTLVDPAAGVYIPKPALLPAFWENTADNLVLSIGMPLTCVKVYEKCLGGYLFHFTDPTCAKEFKSSFPRDLKVGMKVHHFVVDDAPTIHEGIRVRVVRLPPMTDKATVRKIAEVLSLNDDDVVMADVLKSKGGVPTEKGIMIFKVAPVQLLRSNSLMWGKTKLIFY